VSTDLVLRATVREMVVAFERAERDVRAAFAQLVEAERAVNAAFGNTENYQAIRVSACGDQWRDNFKDVDQAVEIMTRAAWRSIVDRLELRRFMSIKAYEAMTKTLDKEKLPPITEESVARFAHDHLARAREYLKEAVDEVFEFLRPHGWTRTGQLKTNSQLEVPERVILSYMVDAGFAAGTFRVTYSGNRSQQIVALENVFSALDGRGEINKAHRSLLAAAIEAAPEGVGQTDLFAFRCCKNGNLHLTFRRPDLLARFNQIAGGTRLRPAESEEQRLKREIAEARAENERLKRAASRTAA
jgi:hypothetical protein